MTDTERREFGHVRMAGGRYDTPGLPLAGADELRRYEALVIKVAKNLFLTDHPRRKRAPRGFDSLGELRITAVNSGSVVPVLERPVTARSSSATLTDVPDYLDRARALINDAFRGVAAPASSVPRGYPPELLRDLAQLGRSLGPVERIEFSSDQEPTPAIVSQETRKRLHAIANLGEFEVERLLIGQVTGLRESPRQFDLALADGTKVTGSFTDSETYDELQTFQGRSDRAPLASLSVVAVVSLQGSLQKVTDVLGIEPALPPAWAERLKVLGGLGRGWLEPDTPSISEQAIDSAEQFLFACLDEGFPRPRIYPTPQGGVILEWPQDDFDLDVEFNDGRAHIQFVSLTSEEEWDKVIDWLDIDSLIEAMGELNDLG
ncbi:hypothetical protein [Janibacter sp. Soil728]|uniref:hypothetical protein n=1 Tax=Janibacter sp. Soil728 TaxID=1736393 RepID=UPI000AE59191|nr:hypothetical protein [Janibacter sp. Soil728]